MPIAIYKDSYYPQLAFKIALKLHELETGKKNDVININEQNNIIIGNKKIAQ